MKIIIVTQNAPIYLAQFLNELFKKIINNSHTVKSVVVFPPYFRKSILGEIKERYDYYGFIDFIKMMLYITGNKFLSTVANICPWIGYYSVKNVINKHKIIRYKTDSVNSKDFIEYIKMNQVDLIISIASPKIFKKELLTAPKKGCINYHTALLPKYRGRQPLFWALLHGEQNVGISIHEMDEKLDNGPIIIQEKIPVASQDSLHKLYLKTIKTGPKLIMDAIEKLDTNNFDRIENDSSQATLYRFPTKEAARLFKSRRNKFF